MKQQPIMIQGTGSHIGKTMLVAGLCRMVARRGLRVAPFKSQNMALNSFVTDEGHEIGRSTAVQAFAAQQRPIVHMNPLLMKPKSDDTSQLIIHGKALADVTAHDYFFANRYQAQRLAAVQESIDYLKAHYDLIIAEGAGSCAEPNLRKPDIVNMGAAHLLGARVYIAADIDKGGVFAELLGTLEVLRLTNPEDLPLVQGFIINKFRGDRTLLEPALDFLRQNTGRPVLGVVPYLPNLQLEEEDSVRQSRCANAQIRIGVLYLPHISNATDFDFLAMEPGVEVLFIRRPDQLAALDALILPGTKNTTADLALLRAAGLAEAILQCAHDTPIIGICGGYQMLGRHLIDPHNLESPHGSMPGLGLMDFEVEFHPRKVLTNRVYHPTAHNPFAAAGPVKGYEIHAGTLRAQSDRPLFTHADGSDGFIHPTRPIFGTFIHDLFRNPAFVRAFVNDLRSRRNLPPLTGPLIDPMARFEDSINRLADTLEQTDLSHIIQY